MVTNKFGAVLANHVSRKFVWFSLLNANQGSVESILFVYAIFIFHSWTTPQESQRLLNDVMLHIEEYKNIDWDACSTADFGPECDYDSYESSEDEH